MTLASLFLLAALVLFGVPAVRALLKGQVDFTNGGLVFLTAAALVGDLLL